MLCPNCETDNREGARFCDQCGFPLTGAMTWAARLESAPEAPVAPDASVDEPLENAASGDGASAHSEPDSQLEEGAACEADPDVTAVIDGVSDGETPPVGDITAVIGEIPADAEFPVDEYGEGFAGGFAAPQPQWRDGHTMQMPTVESDDAPRSRDFIASSTTEQKRTGRLVAGIVAALVVVAALTAFATYQMQLWGGKAVPDVCGMTEVDARGVLEDSGFSVRSTQVKSDDIEGLVLIMDPTAGSRVEEGAEIVIHVAIARYIPDVVGKQESEAAEAFKDAGYENVTFERERSDEAEGTVLSVSPEAGTRAKSSVAVVAKVAEPFSVPDTSGLGFDDVVATIMDAGLTYDVAYVDTESYPEGSVIGTDPVAGAKVKGGSTVVVEVARARGAQLTSLTRNLLSPGSTVNVDGVSYEIETLQSVEYVGDDTVAFTFVGRPYTYFIGQYISLEARRVSGEVVWTADNGVESIS